MTRVFEKDSFDATFCVALSHQKPELYKVGKDMADILLKYLWYLNFLEGKSVILKIQISLSLLNHNAILINFVFSFFNNKAMPFAK